MATPPSASPRRAQRSRGFARLTDWIVMAASLLSGLLPSRSVSKTREFRRFSPAGRPSSGLTPALGIGHRRTVREQLRRRDASRGRLILGAALAVPILIGVVWYVAQSPEEPPDAIAAVVPNGGSADEIQIDPENNQERAANIVKSSSESSPADDSDRVTRRGGWRGPTDDHRRTNSSPGAGHTPSTRSSTIGSSSQSEDSGAFSSSPDEEEADDRSPAKGSPTPPRPTPGKTTPPRTTPPSRSSGSTPELTPESTSESTPESTPELTTTSPPPNSTLTSQPPISPFHSWFF